MAPMFGWSREARTWASRLNRDRRSASRANSAGRIFSATSLFSFVSRARYTSPIPPDPRAERISYGPSREPHARGMNLFHRHALLQLFAPVEHDCNWRGRVWLIGVLSNFR